MQLISNLIVSVVVSLLILSVTSAFSQVEDLHRFSVKEIANAHSQRDTFYVLNDTIPAGDTLVSAAISLTDLLRSRATSVLVRINRSGHIDGAFYAGIRCGVPGESRGPLAFEL